MLSLIGIWEGAQQSEFSIFLKYIVGVGVITVLLMLCSLGGGGTYTFAGMPPELEGYIEPGFLNIGIPHNNPFGGESDEYGTITAYFNDPNYFAYYQRWHKALDLVPSGKYYEENGAYEKTGLPIMFATCSGEATGAIDQNNALYIYLECDGGEYEVLFVHNQRNFIGTDETSRVRAGQPIAVMGATGKADGAHIHYVIKKNGEYVNPLNYLTLNENLDE